MSRPADPFDIDLTPELILRAYQAGIFPMAEDETSDDVFWVCPPMRGVLPLDGFKISSSLRKTLKTHPYRVRVDTDFDATIEGCATAGTDRESTWINPTIRKLYGELFRRGYVHTVEVWDGPDLVGGLYGLAMGGAFFGESMFHRATGASKIALAHLVERLNRGGFVLLDTQFVTDHLASLGGIEIPREIYELRLAHALQQKAHFRAIDNLPLAERRNEDIARAFIHAARTHGRADWPLVDDPVRSLSTVEIVAAMSDAPAVVKALATHPLPALLARLDRSGFPALLAAARRRPVLAQALRRVAPDTLDAYHRKGLTHLLAALAHPATEKE